MINKQLLKRSVDLGIVGSVVVLGKNQLAQVQYEKY